MVGHGDDSFLFDLESMVLVGWGRGVATSMQAAIEMYARQRLFIYLFIFLFPLLSSFCFVRSESSSKLQTRQAISNFHQSGRRKRKCREPVRNTTNRRECLEKR